MTAAAIWFPCRRQDGYPVQPADCVWFQRADDPRRLCIGCEQPEEVRPAVMRTLATLFGLIENKRKQGAFERMWQQRFTEAG